MHIRQPAIAAVVAERQPLVIDAHQVQDGRVQVVLPPLVVRDAARCVVRVDDRRA